MNIFSVENVGYSFGTQKIFQDISFQGRVGEFICITGEVGSGKSTFLKCLAGFLKFVGS